MAGARCWAAALERACRGWAVSAGRRVARPVGVAPVPVRCGCPQTCGRGHSQPSAAPNATSRPNAADGCGPTPTRQQRAGLTGCRLSAMPTHGADRPSRGTRRAQTRSRARGAGCEQRRRLVDTGRVVPVAPATGSLDGRRRAQRAASPHLRRRRSARCSRPCRSSRPLPSRAVLCRASSVAAGVSPFAARAPGCAARSAAHPRGARTLPATAARSTSQRCPCGTAARSQPQRAGRFAQRPASRRRSAPGFSELRSEKLHKERSRGSPTGRQVRGPARRCHSGPR